MRPIVPVAAVVATSAGCALLLGAVPGGADDHPTPTTAVPAALAPAAPAARTAAVPAAGCVPPRCTPPEQKTIRVPNRLITVSQTTFRLRLFKRVANVSRGYSLLKSYKVAVGSPQHRTPNGTYRVDRKALNPSWTAPDSSWVPANQRGKEFQPGSPDNPIAAAFIAISPKEGLGIHGTTNTASLGTRASHGCIRMSIKDVKNLYHRTPVGTPVVISR